MPLGFCIVLVGPGRRMSSDNEAGPWPASLPEAACSALSDD